MIKTELRASQFAEELGLPELALPMAYSMEFEWGSLRATKDAQKAYGLVPLQSNPLEQPTSYKLAKRFAELPRANVVIVGPDQIDPFESGGSLGSDYEDMIHVRTARSHKNIGITASMYQSFDEVEARLETGYAQAHLSEMEGWTCLSDHELDWESSSPGAQLTQFLAHSFARAAKYASQQSMENFLTAKLDRQTLNEVIGWGAAGVALSAAVETSMAVRDLATNPYTVAAMALIVGGTFGAAYKSVRDNLMIRLNNPDSIEAGSRSYDIQNDIHGVYCQTAYRAKGYEAIVEELFGRQENKTP